MPIAGMALAEAPEAAFEGSENAQAVLTNLDYNDLRNVNVWSKEAIYKAGALDILKGYGNRNFGRTNTLSKEEAIALAYRASGREADAQKAAEELDNARAREDKKTNAISMWSDGYLKLAADEGLISEEDFNDALTAGTQELSAGSFRRNAPASRQEFAFWLAKTLSLEPVYGQQEIFNNYNDWRNADPIKIPYIEAILKNNIMSGDGNGYFRPTQPLTRQEAAQIVSNAEKHILPLIGMRKMTGTVESVSNSRDLSNGGSISKKTFNVRNSNGKLHTITVEYPDDPAGSQRREQDGRPVAPNKKELIVIKDNSVGDSSILEIGDRIEYVADINNEIKYVRVISNKKQVEYIAAQINEIDTDGMLLDVLQLFKLEYPDISLIGSIDELNMDGGNLQVKYNYAGNVTVSKNGKRVGITDLYPGENVILTVRDGNMVTSIETFNFGISPDERRIVNGIVEENNPQLGYITLYNEDGTGVSPENKYQLTLFRTYNYSDLRNLEVFKNHKKADIEDIEPGDTVFMKLDDDGNVISISGVDNYTVKYAKVISKRPATIAVQYDDGTQQVLDINDNVLLIAEGKLADYDQLKDGDRVRLLLHETNKFTAVKEIVIEGSEHFITNVYKGLIDRIDETSDKLIVFNTEVLERGRWERIGQKGFLEIRLANDYSIYYDGKEISMEEINKYFSESEAYIAVEKDYGGQERAVLVSIRNKMDSEVLYDDSIYSTASGTGRFTLSKGQGYIRAGAGSIIIKHGRLVSANSISPRDMAYVVANRDYSSGEYVAGVVQITDRPGSGTLQIYRARIKSIEENKGFTVESFSRLDGMLWNYYNTEKTFRLTYSTRILDEEGLINQRDFVGYGDESYVGRVVYIVADDTDAVIVSTAPYGIYNARGVIYRIDTRQSGEGENASEQPVGFNIRDAVIYDPYQHLWTGKNEMEINILKNTIILRGNTILEPSDLRKGDTVRVIKVDNSVSGDAFIIIVEN